MLPPPPDGSPIADLALRTRWLSRPEIAYRIPDVGALFLPDGPHGASVSLTTTSLWARRDQDDPGLQVALEPRDTAAWVGLWLDAWGGPAADTGPLLLRYRGLFRVVSPTDSASFEAWLGTLLRS